MAIDVVENNEQLNNIITLIENKDKLYNITDDEIDILEELPCKRLRLVE